MAGLDLWEGEILSRETSGGADPAGEGGQARRQAITILGAPVEAGASVPGAAMGPAMLRTAGIVKALRDLGHDVEDRGDLAPPHPLVHAAPPEGKAHRFAHVSAWVRLLARETYAVVRSGRTPIVLGGDHSLAMGSISGVARHAAEAKRELFVLWLDAHTDFNTPLTSPSGNMHGMPAAMLSREPGLEAVFGDEPHGFIDPGRLHLFGIRSINSGERLLLQDRGVDVVDMRRLDEDGFAVSIRRSSIGSRPAMAFCMSVWMSTFSIRRSRQASAPPSRAGRPTARRILSWSCCTNPAFALARSGRAQSIPRRAGQERAAAGRPDREPVRPPGLSGRARVGGGRGGREQLTWRRAGIFRAPRQEIDFPPCLERANAQAA